MFCVSDIIGLFVGEFDSLSFGVTDGPFFGYVYSTLLGTAWAFASAFTCEKFLHRTDGVRARVLANANAVLVH